MIIREKEREREIIIYVLLICFFYYLCVGFDNECDIFLYCEWVMFY